jgi:transposase
MSLAIQPLPDDPTALRNFAVDLQAELARKEIEIAANAAEIHAKTLHIEKLKMQLAALRRARFGRSSEKLDHAIEQLELLIGELEADAGAAEARNTAGDPDARQDTKQPVKPRERKHPVRKPLPPHLRRETITHEAACTCPGCGGTVFSRIGQDEREVLEYVPSSFKVIRHIRPKLSCRACETIVQSPMPSLPIERGRPGPGLLSQVLVAKFCDHIPLHRQAGIYAREGVELDRSTLADWVGQSVFLLDPLAEAIGRHVRAGPVLHADDTTIPVLAPGTGKTRTGRLWVVVRDERPFGSDCPPAAYYRYSPDRKGIHAQALLGPCRGFLHADGYAGFNNLYQPTTPDGAPSLIAALFVIESSVRGQPPDQRLAARIQYARPRLDELKLFLEGSLNRISGKSALAGAIRYALTRWNALLRYSTDGRLEMSNNAAERGMRAPVLGRKNYLFCGSDAGGQRAACVYTIVESAKMSGINPQAYLADVLERIADHPIHKIDALLPWLWTK